MTRKKKTYKLSYAGKNQRFARSVVAGDFIFLSGSSGRTIETGEVNSSDVRDQVRVALDKVRSALKEAQSGLENIVKVTIYLKSMQDYDAVKQAEFKYYEQYAPGLVENPPASTVVEVSSLSKPSMLVEFDYIALRGD